MSTNLSKAEIVDIAFEIIIKAVILGGVLFYSLQLLSPFIMPVLWAIIIAVTISPLIDTLESKLKATRTKIVTIFTIFVLAALLIPTYKLSDSLISSTTNFAHEIENGNITIPAPSADVKEWPLIGERLYPVWESASVDVEEVMQQYSTQIKSFGKKILSAAGGFLGSIFQFVVATIIAAIFLSKSDGSVKVYHGISRRLMGEKGVEWAQLSAMTVRSVVQGILGIALIQATLSLIGLIVMDVPFAALWAILVLFLAIVQLPPILILGPIAAYVFSVSDTTPATIFTIYALIISMSDGFLKPLLLGRGVDIPMLVILLGAIGGMILSGIIGLFVGSVVLALTYKLFIVWMDDSVSVDDAIAQKEYKRA